MTTLTVVLIAALAFMLGIFATILVVLYALYLHEVQKEYANLGAKAGVRTEETILSSN